MTDGRPSCEGGLHDRRQFLRLAAFATVATFSAGFADAGPRSRKATKLFDGRTLHGWIQAQNCQFSFASRDILDPHTQQLQSRAASSPHYLRLESHR